MFRNRMGISHRRRQQPQEHWLDHLPEAVVQEYLPEYVAEPYTETKPEVIETTVEVIPDPVEEWVPEEPNLQGLERDARVLIGVLIGSFGIIGMIAATDPVLALALGVIASAVTLYLLATAKTAKDPIKVVAPVPIVD